MTDSELDKLVSHWVRPEIRSLSAYHVPDATGMVKLDAMENPYTWPDELRQEWLTLMAQVDVNRYPDPEAHQLTERLRETMAVPDGMAVLLGNGSDEIIQMIAMAVSDPGRVLLSVDPGFVMYRMIAAFCGMRYVSVPLKAEDFSLDVPAILQAMDETQPAVVFLAYPNNPTGNSFAEADIVRVIEAAPGLVVVDEAYAPFADNSFMDRLGQYDNLVVMRTVSKMGLAGLRLGMLAGPTAWLNEFHKVRMPYNINVLTQVSAEFALRHQAVFDAQTSAICRQRTELVQALSELEGVKPYPSQANFVLVRMPLGRAKAIFSDLKARGVLVKLLHGSHPVLQDCLRFTVGKPEENHLLIEALRAIV